MTIEKIQVQPDTTYWFCSFLLIYITHQLPLCHIWEILSWEVSKLIVKVLQKLKKYNREKVLPTQKNIFNYLVSLLELISSVFPVKEYSPFFLFVQLMQKFWVSCGGQSFSVVSFETAKMILGKEEVPISRSFHLWTFVFRRNWPCSVKISKKQWQSISSTYTSCLSEALCRHHNLWQLRNQCSWSSDITKIHKWKKQNSIFLVYSLN